MENKPRIEQLFDQMLDEAPVMFTPKIKPYILEFAKIYAKEVAEKSLELAAENALVSKNYDMKTFVEKKFNSNMSNTFYIVDKSSITNPKNIILNL